ncbi:MULTISPECIES: acyltransferase family protein [unclassified Legionella]|uniref:acyltransferase family protein n=1 Tax=unclassified Legionella TaxID=2622702 RepID=UPI00105480E6|nr:MULTISPECIES: heparan-alpha-glucosaminide N-acetyltransferase domain-containing protein [unclassified Legionella]MDI9819860.1 heparan-alpha-glucosaminide N-acetyltransferase domain-containing protein [Legionella sp. PL877]
MLLPGKRFPRFLSLDVFRGITIILMILVNSPGNKTVYSWLAHSVWHGCTLADIVFPFFIFIVGVTSVLSLAKSRQQGLSNNLPKIVQRTLIIFLIGLFLNLFPYHFDLSTIRFFGVLQRIAICYFCISLLYLTTRIQTQIVIFISLLIGYWLLMTVVPAPGYGAGNLTPEGNWASCVDRMIFSSPHLYGKIFDPEGLLSTLPAIATALLGSFTGIWLISTNNPRRQLTGLFIAGILGVVTGWVWGLWFPINKSLWTSSYVLFTGGLALIVFAICYWLLDVKGYKKWGKPFEVLGLNAMAAYFLHIFFLKVQLMVPGNLRLLVTDRLFGWSALENASLFYALGYSLLWLLVLTVFYRKRIFLKV